MATLRSSPRHAWDSLAASGQDLGGREALTREPDALHPAAARKCPPIGDCVLDFPYNDEALLLGHHSNSGRVWIPEEAREAGGSFPVLVLLHGIDQAEEPDPPHRLMSGALNLAAMVGRKIREDDIPPVLVAAPSQTREVQGSSTLWTAEGFDLSSFLEALERELSETVTLGIRRDEISVLGHSGAGCVLASSKKNGLFRVAEQLADLRKEGIGVRLLGLADICFFGHGGGAYLASRIEGTGARVFAMWVEPERWNGLDRDLGGFSRALGATSPLPCSTARYEECLQAPDGSMVFKARQETLTQAFGTVSPLPGNQLATEEGLPPHEALVFWLLEEALGLFLGAERSPPPTPPR
jgi:hypothetical protein